MSSIRSFPCRGVESKLGKNNHILDNCAQGPEQPRNRLDQILGFLRVRDHASSIREIACQRQEEEEQSKTLAGLLAVVFDDLGNTRAEKCVSTVLHCVKKEPPVSC